MSAASFSLQRYLDSNFCAISRNSSPPGQYSITKQKYFLSSKNSWYLTTFGESSFLRKTTSFLSLTIFSPNLSFDKALTATLSDLSKALVARITFPNQPMPSTLSNFRMYFLLISLLTGCLRGATYVLKESLRTPSAIFAFGFSGQIPMLTIFTETTKNLII